MDSSVIEALLDPGGRGKKVGQGTDMRDPDHGRIHEDRKC